VKITAPEGSTNSFNTFPENKRYKPKPITGIDFQQSDAYDGYTVLKKLYVMKHKTSQNLQWLLKT
jgi:hypothetical protein